jgi:hypothetical protein
VCVLYVLVLHVCFRTQAVRALSIAAAGIVDFQDSESRNDDVQFSYESGLQASMFCLVLRGDTTTSRRLFDAIAAGCIPVVISDDINLPFSSHIEWSSFLITLPEQEILSSSGSALFNDFGKIVAMLHGNSKDPNYCGKFSGSYLRDECQAWRVVDEMRFNLALARHDLIFAQDPVMGHSIGPVDHHLQEAFDLAHVLTRRQRSTGKRKKNQCKFRRFGDPFRKCILLKNISDFRFISPRAKQVADTLVSSKPPPPQYQGLNCT